MIKTEKNDFSPFCIEQAYLKRQTIQLCDMIAHKKTSSKRNERKISGRLCRSYSQSHSCIVYFSLHRRPEGGGNYLVAHQRAAIIALCIGRMAAVNMDAGACAAVGGRDRCCGRVCVFVCVQVSQRLCVAEPSGHTLLQMCGWQNSCVSVNVSTSMQLCIC